MDVSRESEDEPRPRQVMSGPLSARDRYMLFVTGRFGARQIGHLIKHLELQKQFAEEDDQDDGHETPRDE